MPTRRQIKRDSSVLILVDIQPDFLPGGALAVPDGDAILRPVRKLMESRTLPFMVATQDWHPPNHVSFASQHEGRAPFETIDYYGHEQILWPDHCVQNTPGAELHPDLPWVHAAAIFREAMRPDTDSYSGFRNNWDPQGKRPSNGLAGYLHERETQTVVVCGLARDVCVLWTALDAAESGFVTFFLWDLTRPVDPAHDDDTSRQLADAGVRVIHSSELNPG
ncbi:MAG: nicotinamidase [Candidatus Pacebacteria bacterium]|nr:nicotinamidase [Candidatus Paceibacterota bacterium]